MPRRPKAKAALVEIAPGFYADPREVRRVERRIKKAVGKQPPYDPATLSKIKWGQFDRMSKAWQEAKKGLA